MLCFIVVAFMLSGSIIPGEGALSLQWLPCSPPVTVASPPQVVINASGRYGWNCSTPPAELSDINIQQPLGGDVSPMSVELHVFTSPSDSAINASSCPTFRAIVVVPFTVLDVLYVVLHGTIRYVHSSAESCSNGTGAQTLVRVPIVRIPLNVSINSLVLCFNGTLDVRSSDTIEAAIGASVMIVESDPHEVLIDVTSLGRITMHRIASVVEFNGTFDGDPRAIPVMKMSIQIAGGELKLKSPGGAGWSAFVAVTQPLVNSSIVTAAAKLLLNCVQLATSFENVPCIGLLFAAGGLTNSSLVFTDGTVLQGTHAFVVKTTFATNTSVVVSSASVALLTRNSQGILNADRVFNSSVTVTSGSLVQVSSGGALLLSFGDAREVSIVIVDSVVVVNGTLPTSSNESEIRNANSVSTVMFSFGGSSSAITVTVVRSNVRIADGALLNIDAMSPTSLCLIVITQGSTVVVASNAGLAEHQLAGMVRRSANFVLISNVSVNITARLQVLVSSNSSVCIEANMSPNLNETRVISLEFAPSTAFALMSSRIATLSVHENSSVTIRSGREASTCSFFNFPFGATVDSAVIATSSTIIITGSANVLTALFFISGIVLVENFTCFVEGSVVAIGVNSAAILLAVVRTPQLSNFSIVVAIAKVRLVLLSAAVDVNSGGLLAMFECGGLPLCRADGFELRIDKESSVIVNSSSTVVFGNIRNIRDVNITLAASRIVVFAGSVVAVSSVINESQPMVGSWVDNLTFSAHGALNMTLRGPVGDPVAYSCISSGRTSILTNSTFSFVGNGGSDPMFLRIVGNNFFTIWGYLLNVTFWFKYASLMADSYLSFRAGLIFLASSEWEARRNSTYVADPAFPLSSRDITLTLTQCSYFGRQISVGLLFAHCSLLTDVSITLSESYIVIEDNSFLVAITVSGIVNRLKLRIVNHSVVSLSNISTMLVVSPYTSVAEVHVTAGGNSTVTLWNKSFVVQIQSSNDSAIVVDSLMVEIRDGAAVFMDAVSLFLQVYSPQATLTNLSLIVSNQSRVVAANGSLLAQVSVFTASYLIVTIDFLSTAFVYSGCLLRAGALSNLSNIHLTIDNATVDILGHASSAVAIGSDHGVVRHVVVAVSGCSALRSIQGKLLLIQSNGDVDVVRIVVSGGSAMSIASPKARSPDATYTLVSLLSWQRLSNVSLVFQSATVTVSSMVLLEISQFSLVTGIAITVTSTAVTMTVVVDLCLLVWVVSKTNQLELTCRDAEFALIGQWAGAPVLRLDALFSQDVSMTLTSTNVTMSSTTLAWGFLHSNSNAPSSYVIAKSVSIRVCSNSRFRIIGSGGLIALTTTDPRSFHATTDLKVTVEDSLIEIASSDEGAGSFVLLTEKCFSFGEKSLRMVISNSTVSILNTAGFRAFLQTSNTLEKADILVTNASNITIGQGALFKVILRNSIIVLNASCSVELIAVLPQVVSCVIVSSELNSSSIVISATSVVFRKVYQGSYNTKAFIVFAFVGCNLSVLVTNHSKVWVEWNATENILDINTLFMFLDASSRDITTTFSNFVHLDLRSVNGITFQGPGQLAGCSLRIVNHVTISLRNASDLMILNACESLDLIATNNITILEISGDSSLLRVLTLALDVKVQLSNVSGPQTESMFAFTMWTENVTVTMIDCSVALFPSGKLAGGSPSSLLIFNNSFVVQAIELRIMHSTLTLHGADAIMGRTSLLIILSVMDGAMLAVSQNSIVLENSSVSLLANSAVASLLGVQGGQSPLGKAVLINITIVLVGQTAQLTLNEQDTCVVYRGGDVQGTSNGEPLANGDVRWNASVAVLGGAKVSTRSAGWLLQAQRVRSAGHTITLTMSTSLLENLRPSDVSGSISFVTTDQHDFDEPLSELSSIALIGCDNLIRTGSGKTVIIATRQAMLHRFANVSRARMLVAPDGNCLSTSMSSSPSPYSPSLQHRTVSSAFTASDAATISKYFGSASQSNTIAVRSPYGNVKLQASMGIVRGVAIIASVASSTISVRSASGMGLLQLVSQRVTQHRACASGGDGHYASPPMFSDFVDNPLQISVAAFGVPLSPAGGAMFGCLPLFAIFATVGVIFHALEHGATGFGHNLVVVARARGSYVLPASMVLQPAVTTSVAVLAFVGFRGDVDDVDVTLAVTCAVLMLMCFVIAPLLLFANPFLRGFSGAALVATAAPLREPGTPALAGSGVASRARWAFRCLLDSPWRWEPLDKENADCVAYYRQFGVVVECYRPSLHWFCVAELSFSVANGALSGASLGVLPCTSTGGSGSGGAAAAAVLNWLTLIVTAAFLALSAYLRPYAALFDNAYLITSLALSSIGLIIVLVAPAAESSEVLVVVNYVLLVQSLLGVVSLPRVPLTSSSREAGREDGNGAVLSSAKLDPIALDDAGADMRFWLPHGPGAAAVMQASHQPRLGVRNHAVVDAAPPLGASVVTSTSSNCCVKVALQTQRPSPGIWRDEVLSTIVRQICSRRFSASAELL